LLLLLTTGSSFGFALSQTCFGLCNGFFTSQTFFFSFTCCIGSGKELIIMNPSRALRCVARAEKQC
jgi:hypothetical protein